MNYSPDIKRYDKMIFRRCGNSGLQLPVLSLGLWHNFGAVDDYHNCKEIVYTAFDHGITHFDLANNYGPPPGEAEITFGKILK
ncbi:MAG: aldo/keto reductase, partial [Bacteroidota bacterium]|nr:aldo/keto reductase [Bacteroidota bacterium]